MTRESRKTMVAGSSPELIFSKSVGIGALECHETRKISRNTECIIVAEHNRVQGLA